MKKRGLDFCPAKACGQLRALTTHHILPKRFYGETPYIVYICQKCHTKLEKRIPSRQKLAPSKYFRIVCNFIDNRRLKNESKRQNDISR